MTRSHRTDFAQSCFFPKSLTENLTNYLLVNVHSVLSGHSSWTFANVSRFLAADTYPLCAQSWRSSLSYLNFSTILRYVDTIQLHSINQLKPFTCFCSCFFELKKKWFSLAAPWQQTKKQVYMQLLWMNWGRIFFSLIPDHQTWTNRNQPQLVSEV